MYTENRKKKLEDELDSPLKLPNNKILEQDENWKSQFGQNKNGNNEDKEQEKLEKEEILAKQKADIEKEYAGRENDPELVSSVNKIAEKFRAKKAREQAQKDKLEKEEILAKQKADIEKEYAGRENDPELVSSVNKIAEKFRAKKAREQAQKDKLEKEQMAEGE